MSTADLFGGLLAPPPETPVAPGAVLLHGFALADAPALLAAIGAVTTQAPFRQMTTPGGFRMSVAMSNCGPLGWITDRRGYRYAPLDPDSGQPWPAIPPVLLRLALAAAARAGFEHFIPDACLINRPRPAALSWHRPAKRRQPPGHRRLPAQPDPAQGRLKPCNCPKTSVLQKSSPFTPATRNSGPNASPATASTRA